MIPFNRACVTGRELAYVNSAIDHGPLSGDGPFTARCHALLEEITGARKALLTTSCTHALEMAALLLELEPGDEVICPAFTFVSSVNAFALRGARPVFVDIRHDTLNIDERLVEAAITPRTRAILVVHYAGVACELDEIDALASRYGLTVVEDSAHGLFGRYRGRSLGSTAPLSTLSFHETKNVTCGEGGALLINDARFIDRAEIIREKGTDRSRFFRVRLTGTPGSTSARAICPRICWQRTCSRNSKLDTTSKHGVTPSGSATRTSFVTGRQRVTCAFRLFPGTRIIQRISSTF